MILDCGEKTLGMLVFFSDELLKRKEFRFLIPQSCARFNSMVLKLTQENLSVLRLTTDSYRVGKTYIKVKIQWKYLFRAMDSKGQTIEFMLQTICVQNTFRFCFLSQIGTNIDVRDEVMDYSIGSFRLPSVTT